MTDREQTRRDAERVREFLRLAEYFDSEDGADRYAEAVAALDRIVGALAQAERREESLRAVVATSVAQAERRLFDEETAE